MGMLSFTRKHSRETLEECAKHVLAAERPIYTFVKNTIGSVAEELGTSGYNTGKGETTE